MRTNYRKTEKISLRMGKWLQYTDQGEGIAKQANTTIIICFVFIIVIIALALVFAPKLILSGSIIRWILGIADKSP